MILKGKKTLMNIIFFKFYHQRTESTCSFVISSVDMPSITTGVFVVFFLPFFPPFLPVPPPPFAFGGYSKQHK